MITVISSLGTLPLFLLALLIIFLLKLSFLFTIISLSVRAEKRKLQEAIDEAEKSTRKQNEWRR